MATELNMLLWSVVLGLIYLSVHASLLRMQIGLAPGNDSRDHDPEPNMMTARGQRALRNFLETYPLFVALVVVIVMAGHSSAFTEWGARIWVVARLLYLPAYVFGFGRTRSAIWLASMLGLVMMLVGAFGF